MDLFANNFIAVDFETATPQRMACQIGIAVVENGEIIKKIVRLIQPPNNYYDSMCIRVHHIRPDRTASSPTFAELWPEIKGYLENNVVVAHNAAFDEDTLRKNLAMYGISDEKVLPFKDTMRLFGKQYKLDELCAGFNLPTDGHHDAGWDADMCARVYLYYLAGQEPSQSRISVYRKLNSDQKAEPHKLTLQHFNNQQIRPHGLGNTVIRREIYVGKGLREREDCFFQMIGNLGGFANKNIYDDTDTCLLSNRSMKALENGEPDETLTFIQDYYDHQAFPYVQDFEYISEQDFLDGVKHWCDVTDDDVTRVLYDKYINSTAIN